MLDGALQFTGIAGNVTVGSGTGQNTANMGDDPMLAAITTSNNVVDLLNARDMGIGDDPSLKLLVTVSVAGVGGTNFTVSVQMSVDNVDWPRIIGAFSDRPGAVEALPRYLRLGYTATGTFTAGRFFGFLTLDRQDQLSYPPGIVIAN